MGRPARLVIYLWAAFALLAITPLCSQASEHSLLREFADNPLAALYKVRLLSYFLFLPYLAV